MKPYVLDHLIIRCELINSAIKASDGTATELIIKLSNKLLALEPDDRLAFKNLFLPNGPTKDFAETVLNALLNSPNEEAKALGDEIKSHITPQLPKKEVAALKNPAPIRKKIVKASPPLYAFKKFPFATPAFPIDNRAFLPENEAYTRPITRRKDTNT